jgi:PTH1 family peptidyl-tRNA hydrolase
LSQPIRLLAGLGNPGPRYERTRHNAGYWFADAVVSRWGGSFRANRSFFGEVTECEVGGERLRLIKPATYMNESGRAVAALANYYRISVNEILVAHDEIDLPPGTVRVKRGGGHGGHNGLRDVIPQLGDPGFARLRIGVGHPGHKDAVEGYVLKPAPADEERAIEEAIDRAIELFSDIVAGKLEKAMNELHRRPEEPGTAPASE